MPSHHLHAYGQTYAIDLVHDPAGGRRPEPHLHFQLMDHPSVLLAAGLPFRFRHYQAGDAAQAGVPSNLERFSASAPPGEQKRRNGTMHVD